MEIYPAAMIVILVILFIAMRKRRRPDEPAVPPARRRSGSFGVGPGAAGAIYDLLNEEKRNAIEIIVEDKAAYKEAEHADGNLPDLEAPDGKTP